MQFPSEQNFIQQLSIDCVVLGYDSKQLKVLVSELVFQGNFKALPGGFVFQDEDIDDAAVRILQERTGLTDVYLDQFYTFGKAGRNSSTFIDKMVALNPEMKMGESTYRREYDWYTKRFVSIGYYALVDINKVVPQPTKLDASISWYPIGDLPEMIMDHNDIAAKGLEALRGDLDEKRLAFNLLPETFTMKEVQELYEAISGKPYARNNFQKKILDLDILDRLEKKFTGAANKAPFLYRLKTN